MTLFAKLKFWAIVAGGVGFVVILSLLRVFGAGKTAARLEQAKADKKSREQFQEKIDAGHDAGNRIRDDINLDPDRLRVDDGHKRKPK